MLWSIICCRLIHFCFLFKGIFTLLFLFFFYSYLLTLPFHVTATIQICEASHMLILTALFHVHVQTSFWLMWLWLTGETMLSLAPRGYATFCSRALLAMDGFSRTATSIYSPVTIREPTFPSSLFVFWWIMDDRQTRHQCWAQEQQCPSWQSKETNHSTPR